MNELLKMAQELYNKMVNVMAETNERDLQSKKDCENLKAEAKRLKDLGAELIERTEKLKQVEDIAAALEETRQLKMDISKQVEELNEHRQAFIALRDRTTKELSDEKEALALERSNLADLATKIDGERAKLVEDRKNMKAKILADMANA